MEKCSTCGNISVNDEGQCVVCDESASVNPYLVSNAVAETIGSLSGSSSKSYAKVFVGEKYDLFFSHGDDTPKGWNWAAFFFGAFWFIYRKMYLYAAVYLGLGFLLTGIQMALGISEILINVSSFVLGIAAGSLGNRLYKQHIDKSIVETLSAVKGNDVIPALKAKGGTNIGGLLGAIALMLALFMVAGV